jgi:hypothetical protein
VPRYSDRVAVADHAPVTLLAGKYAPITDGAGFLAADFAKVVEADLRWRATLGGYTSRRFRGGLEVAFAALLPLTGPVVRHVWVETRGGWTACFDNFVVGSDPFGPVSYLAEQIGCRGLTVSCRAGTAKRGAATGFALYGAERTEWLNRVRSVSVVQDAGRWVWTALGAVQSFEDVASYGQRRVRDRLTPELLVRYCGALGIRLDDEAFYGGNGCVVVHTGAPPARTETLAQARAWHGLD